jgi:short-subunit dehydrogenase
VTTQPRRLALITGASSGIGAAFARAYAERDCDLILVARREDRLRALGDELAAKHGITTTPLAVDLSDRDATQHIVATLGDLSPDILINNAGFSIAQTFLASDWAEQRDFLQVQIMTAVELCRALMPAMVERRWGRVINVASVVAYSPGAKGHTLYPAAKSFLIKMSQSFAAEVKEAGVHVTAVAPGQTESEFADANGTRDLVKRGGFMTQKPEDVVATAIKANEKGREVVVSGLNNKIAAALLTHLPDRLTAALIRPTAAKFALPD